MGRDINLSPIYTLGLNENHDASAAIACNGSVISAIATERITGVKHDAHKITKAVKYVVLLKNSNLFNLNDLCKLSE